MQFYDGWIRECIAALPDLRPGWVIESNRPCALTIPWKRLDHVYRTAVDAMNARSVLQYGDPDHSYRVVAL